MAAADLNGELETLLLEMNRASAAAILPLFRAEHGLEDKNASGDFDPVTAADKAGEAAIRQLVARHYPEHGVIGEEYGENRPDAEFVWVIDPIDGTRAFIAGLPVWTTLIGLRHRGAPLLGSIGQPFLGEIYLGGPGGSRLINGERVEPLHARQGVALKDAIIATTDPHTGFQRPEMAAWREVRAASRLARLGCDAYAYAMVAAGTIDLVLEAGLKSWDIEAALPVVAGAGGVVTNWRGDPVGRAGGQVAIAGSLDLLRETLPMLGAAAA